MASSFNEILRKSNFPVEFIEANLIPVTDTSALLSIEMDANLERIIWLHNQKRKADNNLPEKYLMPKYARYQPATGGKGEHSVVERHPGFVMYKERRGQTIPKKHQLKTCTKAKESLDSKYAELLEIMDELNSLVNSST